MNPKIRRLNRWLATATDALDQLVNGVATGDLDADTIEAFRAGDYGRADVSVVLHAMNSLDGDRLRFFVSDVTD